MSSGYAPAPPGPGPIRVHLDARVYLEGLGGYRLARPLAAEASGLGALRVFDKVARALMVTRMGGNPRPCGAGAELVLVAAEEGLRKLDGPIVTIPIPIPIPIPMPDPTPRASDPLHDAAIPVVRRITETVLMAIPA